MYDNAQRQLALPASPVLDWAVASEPTREDPKFNCSFQIARRKSIGSIPKTPSARSPVPWTRSPTTCRYPKFWCGVCAAPKRDTSMSGWDYLRGTCVCKKKKGWGKKWEACSRHQPQREMRLTRSNDIKSCRIFYLVWYDYRNESFLL